MDDHRGDHVFNNSGQFASAEGDINGVTQTQMLSPRQAELRDLLAELRQALGAHADELADSESARASLELLDLQAAQGEPQPSLARLLLTALAGAAGDVGAVLDVIGRMRGLLGV